jgi:hypothetical protein
MPTYVCPPPRLLFSLRLLSVLCISAVTLTAADLAPIPIKYVTPDAVYLAAGRNAGLAEGMHLSVRRTPSEDAPPLAELEITSVAAASALCEVRSSKLPVQAGDLAYLSPTDAQVIETARSAGAAARYAQVVTFTDGDPLDQEVRESLPRPPLPEINRVRGMIGFEFSGIRDRTGAGLNSNDLGLVFRSDMTRIGGSYWNLSGYWRGRLNNRVGPEQQTLSDLMNRTYHISLTYDNPNSPYRLGFGRLYLPWASSLDTLDGGYFARRFGRRVTSGLFAGSMPDPTSWNYSPGRQIAGGFTSYEDGSYESVHYTGTAGLAFTRVMSRPERQFAFFENVLSYQHAFTLYHTIEVDNYRPSLATSRSGAGVSRSFLTLRLQPAKILTLDISHNYFRSTPTFDPRLVGTGLLDNMLFQGLSAGFRLDLPYALTLSTALGKSDRSGDAKSSWNQMYGLTLRHIWTTGIRADFRYTKFNSAFGQGNYRSLMFSRQVGEALRFDLTAGNQNYSSPLAVASRARFVTAAVDWFLARHYVLGGGYTVYRGHAQSYDQVYVNLAFRF